MLIYTWNRMPHQPTGLTFVSISLAFLPEFVDIWNAIRSRRGWRRRRTHHVDDDECDSGGNATTTTTASSSSSPPSILAVVEAKLTLNIPTMGCVACVNKVDASIRGCNSAALIGEETSWLTSKGGAAEISILGRTNEEINRAVNDVVAAVKDAGFRCDVKNLRVNKK